MMRSSAYNRFGVLMGTSARASCPRWLGLRGDSLSMITLISSQGDFCATAFKQFRPRYDTPYYEGLVNKMLDCGNPDKMGYVEYRCLDCGQGHHLVSMSCKSSLCLRCATVYVDDWVTQVSKMLHEGVIYRHIVLTVPDVLRPPFYQNADVLLSPCMQCGVK